MPVESHLITNNINSQLTLVNLSGSRQSDRTNKSGLFHTFISSIAEYNVKASIDIVILLNEL